MLSVPPRATAALSGRRLDLDSDAPWPEISAVIDTPVPEPARGVFRWTERPTPLPDAGEWLDPADPRGPPWLRAFDGEVLVALDERGRYLAGCGRTQHDRQGRELAVGTEPQARARPGTRADEPDDSAGHRRRGVPTYIHGRDNVASCRVADAAGFPDRGWRVMALFDPEATPDVGGSAQIPRGGGGSG